MTNPHNRLPRLSWRHRIVHRRAIPLLILAATILIGVTTAVAVHDLALFELDGDPFHGSAASGITPPGGFSHDWDQVCKEGTALATTPLCTGVSGSSGAQRVLFVTDASGGSSASDDQPATGGTHHVNDLNLWDCTLGGISPVKNDITHAFAAMYSVSGNTYLYFGLDRIDAGTGDAAVGFWFYKGTHTCTPTVDAQGHVTAANFTGVHAIGDLLAVSEFTNGGGVSTIKVYKWVGDNNGDSNSTTPPAPGAGDGALQLLVSSADCRDANGNYINYPDNACATVNKVGTNYNKQGNTITPGTLEGNITPPWPYTNNDSGPAYALGAFFEGGVNATALGLDLGCGGTFLADTQASQSLTSQIHDFAIGNLTLCDLEVTKTGDTISKVGDDANYTITIHNTGGVPLYLDSISDTLGGDLTNSSNYDTSTCGVQGDSLAAGATCTITYHHHVVSGDPDPLNNTVTVTYNSKSDLTGDTVTHTDSHSVNLFQPSITLNKSADKTTAYIGDTVNYTVTITNTSSNDTPTLIRDSITDTLVGDLTNPANYDSSTCSTSLAPSASCTIQYHYVVQASDIPGPLLNTATAHYHPDGFPNDITASHSAGVLLIKPATTLTVNSATTSVHQGDPVNISVRETNTGTGSGNLTLTNVNVTGTNSCPNFTPSATKVGGGAFTGSLAAGEAVDFTCSFTAGASGFTWTADGHGTDSLGNPVPSTGEHVSGDVTTVDLQILITGDSTNEVGVDHTFIVTVNQNTGSGFTAVAGATVSSSISGIGSITGGTCTTTTTDGSGQCTIIVHSTTAGIGTVHASTTVSVLGVSLTRATGDGLSGDSPDTHKTWVDADIQITPDGTNRVGASHTFTGHVNINTGTGGYVNAPDGTQISFTIDSGPGSFTTSNPCTTSGGTGSCTITLTSAVTGVTTVSAHVTLSVGGVSLTRNTNGVGANSGPATKTWVNAKISITPTATNEVGVLHTFTVTLEKDTGTGSFVPAAGEHVDATLTDSNGASHTAPTGSCTNAGPNTDVNGHCTITFTSNSAGTVTGHATSTLSVGGASITVATDGVAPNSGDAVKTFVDANIQITPATASNEVGTNHTLTGHVNVNDGSGGGFVNAPNGTQISFSIISGPGSFVGGINTCTTSLGTGSCTVQITSAVAGTTTIHATTTITVGGVSLTRSTGDAHAGDSADAQKKWVSPATTLTLVSQSPANPVAPGTTVTIIVRETNVGSGTLTNVNVTGTGCSPYSPTNVTLASGAYQDFTCTFSPTVDTHWTALGTGTDELGNPAPATNESVSGDVTIQVLFAGCTPGFFKNHYNATVWDGYFSNPTVGSVFTSAFGNPANASLLDALSFPGGTGTIGAEQNLLRAAVAALLNTVYQTSPLPYPLTTSQVISIVNTALATKDRSTMLNLQLILDGYNNLEGPKC